MSWAGLAPALLFVRPRRLSVGSVANRPDDNQLVMLIQSWRMESTSHINDPAYWLERAQHMRNLADEATDEQSKRVMLQVAQDYEKLATRADQRTKGEKP
jgi:hypothetical protein